MARVELSDTLVEFEGRVRVEEAAERNPDGTLNPSVRGWMVYEHLPAPDAANILLDDWPDVVDGVPYRWMPKSFHADRTAAEAAASALI